jgi:NADH:ubiquinone oxidoreductase subunit
MNIGTRIYTMLNGEKVGSDGLGNVYYQSKRITAGERRRRWVDYKGAAEASSVPPEWHAWLHYTVDAPLAETGRKVWQKPHQPNLTGSAGSYRPSGHDYAGGKRAVATGDYESWTPGS